MVRTPAWVGSEFLKTSAIIDCRATDETIFGGFIRVLLNWRNVACVSSEDALERGQEAGL